MNNLISRFDWVFFASSENFRNCLLLKLNLDFNNYNQLAWNFSSNQIGFIIS